MNLPIINFLFIWAKLLPIAAAAAKSLQSCPTLCNPMDCSPPGSPVPEILQVRTLEWIAISFSNAWKWKVKVKSLNRVRLLGTPWTAAHQAPPSMGFSRQEYWSGVPLLPAAAKSLQSCLTLCDPIDCSPPGVPVSGILQARILEWVAISFSNTWKWKVKVKSLSRVWPSATPWTAAYRLLHPCFLVPNKRVDIRILVVQMVKNPPAMGETQVQSLDWKDPLEKGMTTHSRILAWRIPWTEEPGGLQSMGLQGVGHDWATNTFTGAQILEFFKKEKFFLKWDCVCAQ